MLVRSDRELGFLTKTKTDHLNAASGRGSPWINAVAAGLNFQIRLAGVAPVRFKEIEGGHQFEVSAHAVVRITAVPGIGGGPFPDMHRLEHGAMKEEVVLTSSFPKDFLQYTLHYPPGTSFDYQPALTQAEIDGDGFDGPSWRPDWVIGSFAVFDVTGFKIGHIFRPLVYDPANPANFVWGKLQKTGNALKVLIPSAWRASVPGDIIVDPTVGYTSKGGTETTAQPDRIHTLGPHTPPSNGSLTTVSYYWKNDSGSAAPLTMGAYDASYTGSTASVNLIADSPGANVANGFDGWETRTLDAPADIVTRIGLHVGHNHDTVVLKHYYDASGGFSIRFANMAYVAGTLPQPSSAANEAANRIYSAYGTYTAVSAGGVLIPLSTSGGANS